MRLSVAAAAGVLALLLLLAVSLPLSDAQPLPLPTLPFSYNSYAPLLSEAAMRTHHLGHHKAYTDKLNAALRQLRDSGPKGKALAKLGVDTLLTRLDEVEPAELRREIHHNGGGYTSHELFFRCLSPPSANLSDGSPPPPRRPDEGMKIAEVITRDFGSFEQFKQQFTDLANSVFGSGWVFLYLDGNTKTLKLMQTANQDSPAIVEKNPHHLHLLAIDCWEHVYYLDFKNKRAEFVSAWWEMVNWKRVEQTYASYLTYEEVMRELRAPKPATPAAEAGDTPPSPATAETKEGQPKEEL